MLATVVASITIPACSQDPDLLARVVPVDKKAKQLDTLALQNIREREEWNMPASVLYTDWDNNITHYKGSTLPETYNINLRGFHMPTPSRVITSNFGPRWGRQHKGLDIKVYIGDTIYAAFDGKVRVVDYEGKGYGNYVIIRHSNGLETYYAHMSKHLVRENQTVRAGQPIGLGGNTGRSTGSHLHFETRLCGVALNPCLFFDFRNQDVTGNNYFFRRSTMESESANNLENLEDLEGPISPHTCAHDAHTRLGCAVVRATAHPARCTMRHCRWQPSRRSGGGWRRCHRRRRRRSCWTARPPL